MLRRFTLDPWNAQISPKYDGTFYLLLHTIEIISLPRKLPSVQLHHHHNPLWPMRQCHSVSKSTGTLVKSDRAPNICSWGLKLLVWLWWFHRYCLAISYFTRGETSELMGFFKQCPMAPALIIFTMFAAAPAWFHKGLYAGRQPSSTSKSVASQNLCDSFEGLTFLLGRPRIL